MWTDNETADDLLGFKVHADLLASLVTDQAMLPVTVGLYGDWGSGKSSVMSMLRQALDYELIKDTEPNSPLEKVAVLYFNGWTFEGYDDAKSALLSTILIELGEHQRFGPRVRDGAAKLLKSVNWMRVAKLAIKDIGAPLLAAYASGGASILPQAAKIIGGHLASKEAAEKTSDGKDKSSEKEKHKPEEEKDMWEGLIKKHPEDVGPSNVRAFRHDFAKLLNEGDISALVVIIDDLDRCSPERIVENLEAIKLFLNVERTAFVIGADPRIVRHAVGIRYPRRDFTGIEGNAVADALAQDYLEKLIQVPYSLPRLSAAEVESYMTLLFCIQGLGADACSRVLSHARARRGRERYGRFGYPEVQAAAGVEPIPSTLAESLTFVRAAAPLVTEGLKGNPRQVKRFLNALMLRKRLAQVAELQGLDDATLVKLQILEYTRDERFVELNGWQQADEGFPKKLKELESQAEGSKIPEGSPWAEPFLTKWLRIDPQLGEIDLTEYFWVARDRLAAAYGAADLMPTVVKSALQEMSSGNKGRQHSAVSNLVKRMEHDDRSQFLRALANLLTAKPKDKALFDAFTLLVEQDIPGGVEALVSAVGQAPPESLPASIGVELKMLMEAKSHQALIQPLLKKLELSDSAAGRAMKKSASKEKV